MAFNRVSSGRQARLMVGAVAALLLSLLVTSGVQAAEGIVVYDKPDVDGYHVTVLARPNPVTVGKVSLFIRLGQLTNGGYGETPVRGARVLVEFYHVKGPGADQTSSYLQRQNLVASESEPGTYEVSDSLQNEGVYRITLNIEAATKKTSTSFDLTAAPQPDDRFVSVLLLSLFPLFLAWLVWMYLRKPRQPVAEATGPVAPREEVHR